MILLLLLLLAGPGVLAAEAPVPPAGPPVTDAATVQARGRVLADALRCPVCQGLSAGDSQAEAAVAMRLRAEQFVREGYSDAQIQAWFVDRYGEWVLLEPPRRGRHWIVWLAPVVLLAAGAGLVILRLRAAATVPPSVEPDLPADLAADPFVQRVLADLERG
ncbi:MAG: cytochrome c-type biogenesis protein CcmH [Deltaproteobacteria bacterium]|nr:cytochrome c-type biogenesis protein CcmH [Deltaproteobacteria bacterium]